MLDLIGWLGAVCFAVCAIPQAITSYRLGHARDLSCAFLGLWLLGEVCMILYVLGTTRDWILLTNYIFNLGCLIIIIKYKLKERT